MVSSTLSALYHSPGVVVIKVVKFSAFRSVSLLSIVILPKRYLLPSSILKVIRKFFLLGPSSAIVDFTLKSAYPFFK